MRAATRERCHEKKPSSSLSLSAATRTAEEYDSLQAHEHLYHDKDSHQDCIFVSLLAPDGGVIEVLPRIWPVRRSEGLGYHRETGEVRRDPDE